MFLLVALSGIAQGFLAALYCDAQSSSQVFLLFFLTIFFGVAVTSPDHNALGVLGVVVVIILVPAGVSDGSVDLHTGVLRARTVHLIVTFAPPGCLTEMTSQ